MIKLRPYKLGSKSAKLLAQALRIKRLRENSSYRPPARCTIVNWGSSKPLAHMNVINRPEAVRRAANKLTALQTMKAANLSVPDFTSNSDVAKEWQEDGYRIVCRTILSGHSGNGIIIAQPDDVLPYAPLYTKYTKKDREYRVHVFKGRIIDVCEKRKRSGHDVANSLIRTLNNGWVYCRTMVSLSDAGRSLSIAAVRSLGLDFGAVDLIAKDDRYWVLEVNSAPGLQGTSLQAYVNELRAYV